MPFSQLGLSEKLVSAVTAMGYKEPFPIQKEAIPIILQGKNLLALAKTGSGKTAAFVLPILQNLIHTKKRMNNSISVLILVPTRELAAQVGDEAIKLGKYMDAHFKCKVVFGGVSINPQMIGLHGGADILVATPGRLLDLVGRNTIRLGDVHTLVLDEADRMLDMGFSKDIKKIINLLPVKRQNLLFSATMEKEIESMMGTLFNEPIRIGKEEKDVSIEHIEQTVYKVPQNKKIDLLAHLIKSNNWQQVLVFTSMKHHADNVARKLNKLGITAEAMHGDKSQNARTRALANFKTWATQVLVATDLASRGIDIVDLPFVVNYELPRSPADYIHRIGRTGRAGKNGAAISFVSPDEEAQMKLIEKRLGKKVKIVKIDNL